MRPTALLLGAILTGLPLTADAGEDLAAKREACREEAKQRITVRHRTRVAVDDYRRVVELRTAHVQDCMIRTRIAHDASPAPPKRPNS
jgi:hypothetical protein